MHRLLAIGWILVATPARADGNREEAKAHHELAKVQFAAGKFAQAEVEFKRAYALAPIPDLLFNLGVCQDELHERAAAIDSFERYLATEPSEEDRVAVEERIERLRSESRASPARRSPRRPERTLVPPPATPSTSGPPADRPLWQRWWLWTTVGAVLVGGGVGIGVAVASSSSPPALTYPPVSFLP